MKIALIGYGKMGKVIEEIAIQRGHSIVGRFRSAEPCDASMIKEADVAIEFSIPKAAPSNIEMCFEAKVPVVVGTTGWYHDFDRLKAMARDKKGGLFHATNFSVGVNLFFELNKQLARLMNPREEYNVGLHEIHHVHKLDAPSGTAITIAEGLIDNLDGIDEWTDLGEEKGKLNITHGREGEVPGTHVVTYESNVDKITIKHEAKNRSGFALGSVLAAEWMNNREGVYTMKDMLKL